MTEYSHTPQSGKREATLQFLLEKLLDKKPNGSQLRTVLYHCPRLRSGLWPKFSVVATIDDLLYVLEYCGSLREQAWTELKKRTLLPEDLASVVIFSPIFALEAARLLANFAGPVEAEIWSTVIFEIGPGENAKERALVKELSWQLLQADPSLDELRMIRHWVPPLRGRARVLRDRIVKVRRLIRRVGREYALLYPKKKSRKRPQGHSFL